MGDANHGGVKGAERLELAAVLASPTFARAQRLVKLLDYICEKHFAGQDAEVCEYSIATEVLGRPANFDSAEDAIARVEIHRLRKKLREYYAAEGAHQPLKIIIPPGMYTPIFQEDGNSVAPSPTNGEALLESAAEPVTDPALDEPELPPPAPATRSSGNRRIWLWVAAIIVVAVAAVVVAAFRIAAGRDPEAPPHLTPPPVAAAADNAVRILAGYDRKYIDHQGHTWLPDRYFEGGGQPRAPFRTFFARTADQLLYQNGRIGLTAYNIPLKPGTYEMKLHFTEPVYGPGLETGGGENSRVFDILLNGKVLIDSFDIVSDAGGPLIADIRVFRDIQPGPDGILRLGFHAKREQPIVSAIEIEPAPPHRLNPIRIVTQPNSVTDSRGQIWAADNYYSGGQTSNHWKVVTGTPDADLFANERYGHFSYAIPVAPGAYAVTMYFAETYWGKENEGGGGPGQRVFDVYCNGSAIARNLDILKEAGPNHALIKKFRGLRPTAQGKLNFEFVPAVNYASIFAIEVLDEGR
jgi:malectin (di-glucose binding ER protein)